MAFVSNILKHKLELILHSLNFIGWIISIAGINSYGSDIKKFWGGYLFFMVLGFFYSIASIVLYALDKYSKKVRTIFNHGLTLIIPLILLGGETVNNTRCLALDKCEGKARGIVFGVVLQFIGLISLLLINLIRYEYQQSSTKDFNYQPQSNNISNIYDQKKDELSSQSD
ncbi:hypothetical protein M0812_14508 [Anaeramoeba flamelloides]|uniref:MARVEL domain-containing protein n=1 Tax=Anaeramoeba flamelloides TaxID=1746091 RepID=A0AAV7ZKN3_9EUKA|nr:hypothetical protein M0812_14508 [Anaeramoeba flamelloides]